MHHIWHVHYADFVPSVYAQANKPLDKCQSELTDAMHKSLLQPSQQLISGAFDAEDSLAGFVSLFSSDEHNGNFFDTHGFDAELERLYVQPEFQRRGVGQKLLTHAAEWCRKNQKPNVCLWTFVDNKPALDFYTRHGATVYKQVTYNYIERDVDLLILSWNDFPAAILDKR